MLVSYDYDIRHILRTTPNLGPILYFWERSKLIEYVSISDYPYIECAEDI